MNTSKIEDSDIASLKISSLPTRPTAPAAFGGKGYTATEMKEAFDRLPLYIIERFNRLVDDIFADKDDSISTAMKTGINESHTLCDLFDDILSGELANYLTVFGESLSSYLGKMRTDVDNILSKLN